MLRITLKDLRKSNNVKKEPTEVKIWLLESKKLKKKDSENGGLERTSKEYCCHRVGRSLCPAVNSKCLMMVNILFILLLYKMKKYEGI